MTCVCVMVLIFDGSSEYVAHLRTEEKSVKTTAVDVKHSSNNRCAKYSELTSDTAAMVCVHIGIVYHVGGETKPSLGSIYQDQIYPGVYIEHFDYPLPSPQR